MDASSTNSQPPPKPHTLDYLPANEHHDTRALRRKFYLRALWSGAAFRLVNILVQLLSLSMTVRYLHKERYGVWTTVSTIAAWLTLANFGLGQGLTTRLASLGSARDDNREAAYRSICSTLAVSTLIMLVLLPICLIAASLVPWASLFKLQSSLAIAEVRPTMLISIAMIILTLPLTTGGSILSGYQRMELVNVTVIVSSVASLFMLIFAVSFRLGLPALALTVLLPQTGACLAQLVIAGRLGLIKLKARYISFQEAWKMMGLGVKFLITQLFGIFIFETGALIIATKFGVSEVTPYGIVNRMVMVIVTGFTVILTPLWPAYGDAFGRGDTEWARRVFFKSVRVVVGLWLCAALVLGTAGRWIILIWAGPEAVPSWLLLWSMLGYALSFGFGLVVAHPLNGSGRLTSQVVAAVVCGLLNVPLAIFLADKLGIVGVVVSQTSLMFLLAIPIQLFGVMRLIRPSSPAPTQALSAS